MDSSKSEIKIDVTTLPPDMAQKLVVLSASTGKPVDQVIVEMVAIVTTPPNGRKTA